jgi:hypothetical protein
MNEGQEHQWHIELDDMRARVRFALDNIDSLSKRKDVTGQLEVVLNRLDELCEITKGEVNETK